MIFDGLGIKDKEGNNGANTSYQQSISNIIGVVSGGITNAKDEDLAQLGNIAKNATAYNVSVMMLPSMLKKTSTPSQNIMKATTTTALPVYKGK